MNRNLAAARNRTPLEIHLKSLSANKEALFQNRRFSEDSQFLIIQN